MEVDERLRWLESRVNSSLHPKGEKLRNLFSDSENRSTFLDFCNNSETRHLFVHLPEDDEFRSPCVSPTPPDSLTAKTLFFLKSSRTSRLSKETISEEVVYTECSQNPIEHLELVVRDIYLPMLAEQKDIGQNVSSERLLDILHRLISSIQVTQGHQSGDLVLPVPSIDVLIEGAVSGGNERRAMIVHIMESCVISWMKQVKMAMHFDPNGSIIKINGKMAGPMAEIRYWEHRHQQLILVRDQFSSVEVLRILNGLEHARSTYADAFIDIHRDMSKSIIDTEFVLMYVHTLKPWFLKLHAAISPDTLTKLFPSLVMTLSLVWQHSGLYAQVPHFHRLLRLISNELATKAKDIVGEDPLSHPVQACVHIRQALRVCSAFRGYYLDRRDVTERILQQRKEQLNQLQQESIHHTQSKESSFDSYTVIGSGFSLSRQVPNELGSPLQLCHWPPRNATVFTSLNSTLERCNDLLELVQTIEHFSELAAVANQCSSDGQDPVLTDIYYQFQETLDTFRNSTKDLMSLEQTGFEKSFFQFRSSVKELEAHLSSVLLEYFDESLSLESTLRLLESFQGLISREYTQNVLMPKLDSIIDIIQSDVNMIRDTLSSFVLNTPMLPNTPPTSSKLLWLRALRQRVDVPIERIRLAAPYLLQGEKGFTLRHTHNEVLRAIEHQWNEILSVWTKGIPDSIKSALEETILKQTDDTGELQVNLNLKLEEVLRETHYLTGPLLSVTLPTSIHSISNRLSPHVLHQYRVSLEVCTRQYNTLQQSLDPIHRGLFQHKLSLLDKLLQGGLHQWNWLSLELPDFLAKLKTSLQGDLLPAVERVLQQTETVELITRSWTELPGLDMFRESEKSCMEQLTIKYSELMESANRLLSISASQIEGIYKEAFECVEVSWDSPAWSGYLSHLDSMIFNGLKQMILYSMNTLISRAQKYEQGGSIPPMVAVSLEHHEKEIQFSPPLSSYSSLASVPEKIKNFLEGFVSMSTIPHRLAQLKQSYYDEISTDAEVQGNLQKITAHVETSARQCQSLRKRFSQYAFLWEQDVLATFDDFINGIGQPHPRRFTRPETVNRSRSASHSSRSRSHSAVPAVSSQTTSSVLESVTGISDWEFLKPENPSTRDSSSRENRKIRNPTLEDFDGEIAVFQGILERLASCLDIVDVGWISVNQCPVKNALTSMANKWTYVYANYLEKKVLMVLNELELFFTEIEPQVEAISGESVDPDHIMTLVTIFNKVNLQQLVMDGKFGAVHRAVAILDKFHQPLPVNARDHFEGVPHRWSSLKKRLALSKQRIAPLIQSHSSSITHDLEQFGLQATRERQSFLMSACLLHRSDPQLAKDLIREYSQKLMALRIQAKDLMELQELLQSAVVNFNILNQFEEELNNAYLLWERQQIITEYHTAIKCQVWLAVDIEEMRDSCQNHMDLLTSLDPCSIDWDIRIHFEVAVKETQLTVPLLEGLSSGHMRPRHWKQVLRYSNNHSLLVVLLKNGALELNVLRQLTLGRFMELKLTDHSIDILAIVDRASKEVAIEELLKNLEEVWLSMQFHLKPYFRLHGHEQAVSDIGMEAGRVSSLAYSSPIVRRRSVSSAHVPVISATPNISDKHSSQESLMLLDDVEKIFEALNHYQTSLQSLEGSVAANSFTDELHHWHKQLQTVEAVLRVWLQVQSLWVQLEEILTSGEATQHIPTVHFNFSTMNKDWKQLMRATAKAPNVISSCLQEDLLQTLEKFLTTLNQCQSALLQYVQGKRARCPWLYFLPLEDVLQLVCYASNVSILCRIFPKIITHSTGIIFNNSLPWVSIDHTHSVLPRITSITGSVGEKLDLIEAVDCDGAVENILNHVLHSITETLKQQLHHCLTQSSSNTLPKRLTSLWASSSLSHQIIQLSTIILLDQTLQAALERASKEEEGKTLETLLTDIQSSIQFLQYIDQGQLPSDTKALSVTELIEHSHQPTSDTVALDVVDSTAVLNTSGSHQLTDTSSAIPQIDSQQAMATNDSSAAAPKGPAAMLESRHALYQSIMSILLAYRQKISELMTETVSCSSFKWQSSVHYAYDETQKACHLTSVGVVLNYGFHYSGGYPLSLAPPTEKLMVHLLNVMNQHFSGHIATEQIEPATVNDIAVNCGYPLFPIHCSPATSRSVLIDYFRGIATTGSWLYLCSFHLLPLTLVQTVVELIEIVREAKSKATRVVKISGETLRMAKVETSFCIASTRRLLASFTSSSVHSVFKTYSLAEAPAAIVYEAMLLAKGFFSANILSQFLSRYSKEHSISKSVIQALVNRSAQHISSYCNTAELTAVSLSSNIAQQVILSQLHGPSHHSSNISSRQGEKPGPPPLAVVYEENEELPSETTTSSVQEQLEPLSILVSMWELQLPLPMQLLGDYFPNLPFAIVRDELGKAQVDIANEFPWSREAVESAQESRATSVMLSDRDKETELHYLEDAIIEACFIKGLVPSAELQRDVNTLVQMILVHRVMRINGQWQNGRRECIETSIEVLKCIGYSVNVNALPIDAIQTGGLVGDQKDIAVLPQLLSKLPRSTSNSLQLIILEGRPSEELLDCLQWLIRKEESLIHFPNMISILLDPSVKFIVISAPDAAQVSPINFPTLSLSQLCCSLWQYNTQTAFLQFDREIQNQLTLLCQTHLPELFSLLSVNDSTLMNCYCVQVDKLQIVNSMCEILKCLLVGAHLSSTKAIDCCFIYALIWAFGGAFNEQGRLVFEKWTRETFSDALSSLQESLWHYRLTLSFEFELCSLTVTDTTATATEYIYTKKRKALAELIQLLYSNDVPLLVDGSCGSGKTSFLVNTINSRNGGPDCGVHSLMHTYINQLSSPATFWSQLQENLMWHSGITYVPQNCESLIAFLDDLHLSQASDSGSVTALVNHHIASGTILAPSSYKEHNVGGVTYVLSTDTTQAPLMNDILSNVVYIYWEEYSSDELIFIYSVLLKTHFLSSATGLLTAELITLLVEASVQVHIKLQSMFIDTEERKHYSFTAAILDATLRHLTLQLDSTATPQELLSCWLYESYWNYASQLTTVVDRERYQECIANALKKFFSDSPLLSSLLLQSPLSCKVDKDLMREKLCNVQKELNDISPTPPLSLYDFTLSLSLRLSSLLESPHSLSSTLLIGMGHIEQLLLLITASQGFTLQRPSQMLMSTSANQTGIQHFRNALKAIYTTAGVKNERILVFLDDQELHDSLYIPFVYQFMKDCSVTVEFTAEERARVVNSLRSDITQSGSDYTEQLAWDFFINRVKTNVRYVLSLPTFNFAHQCGLIEMRNFHCVVKVCYQLTWDRRALLHVSNYHLKKCHLPDSLQESIAHLLTSLHMILRDVLHSNSKACCHNSMFEYFVERFCYEIQEWWKKLSEECQQLDNAIDTFSKTQERSLFLKEKLIREDIVLEEKGKSYTQLLVQIGQDSAIAKEQDKLVQKQSERIEHLQKVLPEYEHVYSLYIEDLERIERQTKKIALNLDQQSLLELRSLQKPPQEIQELLEAVIIIVKSPTADLSWTKGAKRVMANLDRFSEMLMEFSQHQESSEALLDSLHPYTLRPSFNEDSLGKMYFVAGQLCCWVKGVESYHRLLQDNVRRLEYRKSHVRASLQEYTERLSQLDQKVQALDERLQGLSISLEQASIEKTYQSQVVNKMSKELQETAQFIKSLSTHYTKWISTKNKLSSALTNRIGQLALSTCFVTYLTSLDPHLALTVIRDYLKPSILEKGFSLDPGMPLQGILGSLESDSSTPQSLPTIKKQESQLLDQQLSVNGDSTSKDSDPSHSVEDSDSNHPVEENSNPSHPFPGSPYKETEPSEDPSQNKPADISTSYQYQQLCMDVLLTLNPATSLQSLSQTNLLHQLYKELLVRSWNKWLLIYDPEDIMTSLLSDDWIVLDGQNCTPQLLQSIEQALVEGHQLVLKKTALPFHSSLIPVIEAGLSWHKTDKRALSLDFCGHRIHVNKSFRLIMTVITDTSTCQALSCRLHAINMCPSLPLVQELLLQEAQRTTSESSLHEYETVVFAISESCRQRRELGDKLLTYLRKVDNGIIDSYTIAQVEQLMNSFIELQVVFHSQYQSLDNCLLYLDRVRPVSLFVSLVFVLLQLLSKQIPEFLVTWRECEALFRQIIIESSIMESKEDSNATAQFKKVFTESILKTISRYLSYPQLYAVASCLYVLSLLDTSCAVTASQVDQLLFVLQSDDDTYLEDIESSVTDEQLPPKPDYITEQLLLKLYILPVSISLIETVRESMFTKPTVWKELLQDSVLPSSSQLPWVSSAAENETRMEYALEDLVLLKAIAPNAISSHINDSVAQLLQSIAVPLLSEVLASNRDIPLLLLYNENELVSQANLVLFQDALNCLRNDQNEGESQSLVTLSFGLDNEDELLVKLEKANADFVLVKDIHLASEACLKTIPFRLQGIQSRAQRLILIGSHCISLPVQLLHQCYLVSLSKVAPTPQFQQLPSHQLRNDTNDEILKYLYTLLTVFTCLPQTLLEDLNKLSPKKQWLVFLLSAFHTHLFSSTSPTPQLHNLLFVLSQLSSDISLEMLLLILQSLLKNLYSRTCSDTVVSLYLNSDLLKDEAVDLRVSEEFVLPLPPFSVSPTNYSNHIIGVIEGKAETRRSFSSSSSRQQFLTILQSTLSLIVAL